MTPRANNFARCGCGRSADKPYCDGSHALSEAEYKQRLFESLPRIVCEDPIGCTCPDQCRNTMICQRMRNR